MRISAKLKILCATLSVALMSSSASAAQQYCTGKITHIFTGMYGQFYVLPDWRGDWLMACNINQTSGGVSPEVCKTWIAMVMSALHADKTMTVYYTDAPSCQTIPTYDSAPAPYYFLTIK